MFDGSQVTFIYIACYIQIVSNQLYSDEQEHNDFGMQNRV